MTSTYQLRSLKKQPSNTDPVPALDSTASKDLRTMVVNKPGFLSPTLFKKFKNMATRTPPQSKLPGFNLVVAKGSTKKRAVTKRLVRNPTTRVDSSTNPTKHVEKPNTSQERVTRDSAELDPTVTIPTMSTIEDIASPFISDTQPVLPTPLVDFHIWEEGCVDMVQIQDQVEGQVEGRVEGEVEGEVGKENTAPFVDLTDPVVESVTNTSARSTLADVKITAMAEYQKLIGKAYKVASSPSTLFKSLKKRFTDMPPPSKSTRTVGSKHYRATSVNLFKRPFLSSPVHPMPLHVQTSRLARLFQPCEGPVIEEGTIEKVKELIRDSHMSLRPRPVGKPGGDAVTYHSIRKKTRMPRKSCA